MLKIRYENIHRDNMVVSTVGKIDCPNCKKVTTIVSAANSYCIHCKCELPVLVGRMRFSPTARVYHHSFGE